MPDRYDLADLHPYRWPPEDRWALLVDRVCVLERRCNALVRESRRQMGFLSLFAVLFVLLLSMRW